MPKLNIFALCEKVIMDEQKNPSLISLMENLDVDPREGKIPKNAVIAKEWAIFTQWQLSDDEQEKPFHQVIHAFWPDGTEFNKTIHSLPTQQAEVKQINMAVVGLPIGQEGKITVKLWLELESKPVTETFFKTLKITHPPQK